MQKTSATASLNATILLLENRQAVEWGLVKEQIHIIHESLKPVNLIKSAFKELTISPGIKNNMIDTTIGLTTGYIARKILSGVTRSPLMNILGTILQIGITNVVTKHPDAIKLSGRSILNKIFNRRENDTIR